MAQLENILNDLSYQQYLNAQLAYANTVLGRQATVHGRSARLMDMIVKVCHAPLCSCSCNDDCTCSHVVCYCCWACCAIMMR